MNTAGRAIAIFACILFLAPLATAQTAAPTVLSVVNDLFDVVDIDAIEFEPGCGGGAFEVLPGGDGFRFYEENEFAAGTAPNANGYEATGCGTARYPVTLPEGLDHFHARFLATRSIELFTVNSAEQSNQGINAEQFVAIQDHVDREIDRVHYFSNSDASREEEFVDPQPSFRHAGGQDVDIVWEFADAGFATDQSVPNFLSGVSFEATVREPVIEYSYVPASKSHVVQSQSRESGGFIGTTVVTSTLSNATTEAFDQVNVRVNVDGRPDLQHVVLPNGTILDSGATRESSGPLGYNPDEVLVETFGSTTWFTVPYGIVAEAGPGDYVFVIEGRESLPASNALRVFATIISFLPLVASIVAIRDTVRFRKEAFGSFKRSATWLTLAIVILFTYYVLVMISAVASGVIYRMTTIPMDVAGVLLYVQVIIAIVGFVIVSIVGRELFRITVPRRPE